MLKCLQTGQRPLCRSRRETARPSGIIWVVRVYLIDGYSLLYRAFYALPQSISTSSGLPTNALYGFTSMLLKLLDSEEEVGIGVVWDGGMPAFRLEVFPEYKAQRSAMPEELRCSSTTWMRSSKL